LFKVALHFDTDLFKAIEMLIKYWCLAHKNKIINLEKQLNDPHASF